MERSWNIVDVYVENRILLKPVVLGGVTSVANFITGREQTGLNRICYFLFFGVFLAPEGSLSSLLQLMLCRLAAVKTHRVHRYSADYIFWSFRIIRFILSYFENILFTVGKQTPCMLSFAYTSSACVLIRKGYFSDKQVNAFRISYIISGHVLHKPYHMRNKVRFMKLYPFSPSSLWFEITPKDFL